MALGLAAIGCAVSFGLAMVFGGDVAVAAPLAAVLQLVSACIGAAAGAAQRSKRLFRFSIEDHNRAFLLAVGLNEVGGSGNTLADNQGNEMVVGDWRRDRIVLRQTNGKGVGSISLDPDGRMLRYSPPS